MTQHLVHAAKARHDDVMKRATTSLRQMARAGEPVTFVAVARQAGVSTDFLYSTRPSAHGSSNYADNRRHSRLNRQRVPITAHRARPRSARWRHS